MCDAKYINDCGKIGTIELKSRNGKVLGICCSEECANELAGEISEGTWCPYPKAKNSLTPDQVERNLAEFDYRYRDN